MNLKEQNLATFLFRIQESEEVPWVRIKDFDNIDLPRPVGLINGSFDILHSGHMKVIFAARKKAQTLVCALDSDEKIRKSKGPTRPIQSWIERATTLNYMPIDYVVEIESNEDMTNLMAVLQPNFRVQGSDYQRSTSRFPWVRKYFIPCNGMRTSMIIDRITKNSGRS